jgi:hypothetical protein
MHPLPLEYILVVIWCGCLHLRSLTGTSSELVAAAAAKSRPRKAALAKAAAVERSPQLSPARQRRGRRLVRRGNLKVGRTGIKGGLTVRVAFTFIPDRN